MLQLEVNRLRGYIVHGKEKIAIHATGYLILDMLRDGPKTREQLMTGALKNKATNTTSRSQILSSNIQMVKRLLAENNLPFVISKKTIDSQVLYALEPKGFSRKTEKRKTANV